MTRKDDWKVNLKRFLIIGVLFFAVTVPSRQLMRVTDVSEIRPVSAFPPVFGLMYGWVGALACAAANLLADIVFGYGPVLCAGDFVVQMLFGLLPWAVWKKLGGEVDLKSADHLKRYNLLIILDAFLTAVLIGISLQTAGLASLLSMTTVFLFLNNYVFGISVGQQIIILKNAYDHKHDRGSMNQQFVMVFQILGIMSAILISIFAYNEVHHNAQDAAALWNTVFLYVAADIFVFSTATYIILSFVEKNISRPVEELAAAARGYVQKGLMESDTNEVRQICERHKEVRGEAGDLAYAYGTMLQELEQYIDHLTAVTAEKERIGAELNVATQIQADMLPSIFPAFPDRKEFDIYATMEPAKEVGGDFYDFFLVDEDHLAMVIADVSGKGVPAALFMVIAKTLIKNRAQMGGTPAEILTDVNNQLCEGNEAELFVTVWLAIVEISTGKGLAANAGHEHPVLRRADGAYELVKYRHSPALAVMEGLRYKEHEFRLYPGDRLYVYTDGVPEATNADNELYGTDRMLAALNRGDYADGKALLEGVRSDMDTFVEQAPQFDDITMLCLTYFGS